MIKTTDITFDLTDKLASISNDLKHFRKENTGDAKTYLDTLKTTKNNLSLVIKDIETEISIRIAAGDISTEVSEKINMIHLLSVFNSSDEKLCQEFFADMNKRYISRNRADYIMLDFEKILKHFIEYVRACFDLDNENIDISEEDSITIQHMLKGVESRLIKIFEYKKNRKSPLDFYHVQKIINQYDKK